MFKKVIFSTRTSTAAWIAVLLPFAMAARPPTGLDKGMLRSFGGYEMFALSKMRSGTVDRVESECMYESVRVCMSEWSECLCLCPWREK